MAQGAGAAEGALDLRFHKPFEVWVDGPRLPRGKRGGEQGERHWSSLAGAGRLHRSPVEARMVIVFAFARITLSKTVRPDLFARSSITPSSPAPMRVPGSLKSKWHLRVLTFRCRCDQSRNA